MPPLLRGDHNYVLSALQGIGPKDALEGQLAADMVGVNAAAMHFLALGMTQGQPFEAVEAYVNCANKLFRDLHFSDGSAEPAPRKNRLLRL